MQRTYATNLSIPQICTTFISMRRQETSCSNTQLYLRHLQFTNRYEENSVKSFVHFAIFSVYCIAPFRHYLITRLQLYFRESKVAHSGLTIFVWSLSRIPPSTNRQSINQPNKQAGNSRSGWNSEAGFLIQTRSLIMWLRTRYNQFSKSHGEAIL